MAFERISGGDRGFKTGTLSSLAVTTGDLLAKDRANAKLILADNATSREDIAGVAVETVANTVTSIKYQDIQDGDRYKVDTTNNSDAASNNERMILTDEATVNNTGTDSGSDAALVEQVDTLGAAGDKKIIVEFIRIMDRA